ncbi:tetratricopeptide repeat protein [Bacillus sp. 179-C3.3 HS]|uniref:tetratricopeptide repeat protein n=1 Tax=Bacillus sp. 179-C3.3 HS TaxID=3232162 RepID=UPI0039A1131A
MNSSLKEAIKLVEAGEIEKGLTILAQAEKHLHDEEKAQAAQLYYDWGDIDKARQLIRDLHDLYPEETGLACFYAELLIDSDEEEKAIAVLESIPEDDDAYPECLLLMADLYQMQGLFEVSEQKLLKAKELLPQETVIDFALGELYFSQGLSKKAAEYFYHVATQQNEVGGINVYQRLAESLSTAGEFEDALEWYEKAVQDQAEPNTLFGYGFTAMRAGKTKTAIHQLSELKEIDPSYSSLYMPLAKCYEEEGQYFEALDIVKEGIKMDEYNKELYLYGAKIGLKNGQADDAKKLLQEALALDPGYIEAIQTLLAVYLNEELFDEILDLIQEVRNFGEDDPKLNWYAATASVGREEYKEAADYFKRALPDFEEERDFLHEYALFLLEEGRQKEVLPLLRKVLQKDGTNEEIEEMILRIEDEISL